jgi:hypothetical protein
VKTLRPLVVCAPLNTSVLYSEAPLQHKVSYKGSTVFWNITPCTPLKVRGKYRLHLQGRKK